jgi:hypothetical protein
MDHRSKGRFKVDGRRFVPAAEFTPDFQSMSILDESLCRDIAIWLKKSQPAL